jgi:hypothetical protein
MKLVKTEKSLDVAAAKAGMSPKTARRYRDAKASPSELKKPHTWRTRVDVFEGVWEEVLELLEVNSGLEAKTLFEELQRRYPGRFSDGQLRSLQRRVKAWRATEGPDREVFFAQEHRPGELAQSDFTHMESLGVTIAGQPFAHLVYHLVLTYSNWETGMVCFSESFESLAAGMEGALFALGGVPKVHQSDRLSAAVSNLSDPAEFTERYAALLRHYGLEGRMIQAARANENGDVEQRHHRFKRAVDQALMLRGGRDFDSREAYEAFLQGLFDQLNAGRRERLSEELAVLRELPATRYDACKKLPCKVGQGSTISVERNVYSVPARLIGEAVEARLYAGHVEVWYAGRQVATMPRLRGRGGHRINYRHIIDWLVRKPGAFKNYRYRADLFPTSRFRMALDLLELQQPARAHKVYLAILRLAARENESLVDDALRVLLDREQAISAEAVETLLRQAQALPLPTEVRIDDVDLNAYDALISGRGSSDGEGGQ